MRDKLKRVLPRAVVAAARECSGLPPHVVMTYLRLRAARGIGARRDLSAVPAQPKTLLFVCHGNIMRSPFAAELTRVRLADAGRIAIGSAGTAATNGRPADPRAVAAATRYGISLATHRATLLTREIVARSDLICVMDHRNEAEVIARFPTASPKTVLLGGMEESGGAGPNIPDPYVLEADEVARIYARLERAVGALVKRLLVR